MSEVQLKLKLGQVEIEYTGSEDFAGTQLLSIIQDALALEIPNLPPPTTTTRADSPTPPIDSASDSKARLSTTDFAVKMGAKSGTDLVVAAAAAMHHSQGKEEFRRSEILSEMKGAKAFYRASYGSNLSKSLDMLVKSGRLQNPRSDTYALPYAEILNTQSYA